MIIVDYIKNLFRKKKVYLERFNLAYQRGDLENAVEILSKHKSLVNKLGDNEMNDIENFINLSLNLDFYEKGNNYKKINFKDIKLNKEYSHSINQDG